MSENDDTQRKHAQLKSLLEQGQLVEHSQKHPIPGETTNVVRIGDREYTGTAILETLALLTDEVVAEILSIDLQLFSHDNAGSASMGGEMSVFSTLMLIASEKPTVRRRLRELKTR